MADTLLAVKGLQTTSGPFRRRVVDMAKRLGANPDFLVAVMAFETGYTFSPSVENPDPRSDSIGLIQFTGVAKKRLGVTHQQLKAMTATEQLKWVEKYYRIYKKHLTPSDSYGNMANHYLAVLAPVGLSKPDDFVVYSAINTPKLYAPNAKLDTNKDGSITVREAVAPVAGIVASAKSRARLPVPASAGPPPMAPRRADISPLAALAVGSLFLLGIRKWRRHAAVSRSLDR